MTVKHDRSDGLMHSQNHACSELGKQAKSRLTMVPEYDDGPVHSPNNACSEPGQPRH
jgi:hypothetical protein